MQQQSDSSLPLTRLLFVGVFLPAVFSFIDAQLLAQHSLHTRDLPATVIMLAVFVFQIGIMGYLCARFIAPPFLKWLIYGWCWLLVDLQTLTAASFTAPGYGHQLLALSLVAAQLGLVLIWGVLGTTWWAVRAPVSLLAAAAMSIPLFNRSFNYGYDSSAFFIAQSASLLAIVIFLRLRRFRLTPPPDGGAEELFGSSGKDLGNSQFSLRDVIIWTSSLAVVLALFRAFDLLSPARYSYFSIQDWTTYVSGGVIVAMTLLVALWAALGQGSAWRRWAILVLACAAGGAANFVMESLFGHNGVYSPYPSISFYSDPLLHWKLQWQMNWWLAAWVSLAGGMLFAALVFFRTLGYRLVQPSKSAQA